MFDSKWDKIKKLYIESNTTLSTRELSAACKELLNIEISYTQISIVMKKENWVSLRANYWNDKGMPEKIQAVSYYDKVKKRSKELRKFDDLIEETFKVIETGIKTIREKQTTGKGMLIDPSKLTSLVTALDGMTKLRKYMEMNNESLTNGEKANANIDKKSEELSRSIIEALTASRVEPMSSQSIGEEDNRLSVDVDGQEGGTSETDSNSLSES